MTIQKITLKNDFHNTEINLRAKVTSTGFYLSKRQIDKANQTLCGMTDCMCEKYYLDGYEIVPIHDKGHGIGWTITGYNLYPNIVR